MNLQESVFSSVSISISVFYYVCIEEVGDDGVARPVTVMDSESLLSKVFTSLKSFYVNYATFDSRECSNGKLDSWRQACSTHRHSSACFHSVLMANQWKSGITPISAWTKIHEERSRILSWIFTDYATVQVSLRLKLSWLQYADCL